MSGVGWTVMLPSESVSQTAFRTILMVKAANNHRLHIKEVSLTFRDVEVLGVPIIVEVYIPSTDGTLTSVTPQKLVDSDPESLQFTAFKQHDTPASHAEPTVGRSLFRRQVTPDAGEFYWGAIREADYWPVPGNTRWAIRIESLESDDASAQDIVVEGTIKGEE